MLGQFSCGVFVFSELVQDAEREAAARVVELRISVGEDDRLQGVCWPRTRSRGRNAPMLM